MVPDPAGARREDAAPREAEVEHLETGTCSAFEIPSKRAWYPRSRFGGVPAGWFPDRATATVKVASRSRSLDRSSQHSAGMFGHPCSIRKPAPAAPNMKSSGNPGDVQSISAAPAGLEARLFIEEPGPRMSYFAPGHTRAHE